jgi:hypothetical protein
MADGRLVAGTWAQKVVEMVANCSGRAEMVAMENLAW